MKLNKETLSLFWRGCKATFPLVVAAPAFAIVYASLASEAGFSGAEAQGMSLLMFTAASQVAILQFLIDDVSLWTIIVIVILMNIHHSLYGLSLVRYLSFKRFPRQIVAFGLTDFAYAVTIAKPENTKLAFLLGAEISIYLTWNIATAIALLSMQFLDVLQTLPGDFIVPLTFFLLLVTVIKNRRDILVAGFSMLIAIIFMLVGVGSASVTLVAIIGAGFGVMLHKFTAKLG